MSRLDSPDSYYIKADCWYYEMKDIFDYKKSFDYAGFNDKEIELLFDRDGIYGGLAERKYWTSEIYSFGQQIRNYGYFPSWLPLYCMASHGVTLNTIIAPHEINNDAYAHLEMSRARYEVMKESPIQRVYPIMAPLVWYRRRHKIEQKTDAVGTLAFPAHSTREVDLYSDIRKYIEELRSLPAEFHPLVVCLHDADIQKGQHNIFMEYGFPIYSAGPTGDIRYAKRWYDIVRHFKFTTSNKVGSYSMYSVEMGIPFFLHGETPVLYNKSDPNIEKGIYASWKHLPEYVECQKAFCDFFGEVTEEQKRLAEKYLGLSECISRKELAKVLYAAFFSHGHMRKDLYHPLRRLWRLFKRAQRHDRKLQKYFANKG